MTTIWVTGATGLLGRGVMRELERVSGWTVRGTGFRRASGRIDRLDLRDEAAVREYGDALRPDVILHSAAERRPDVSEQDPEGTRKINVESTRWIAECARSAGAWLIFMSTDYVFDGTQPPYAPADETHPLNFYGRTKRDGERVVRDVVGDAAVLRVPILYGDVETLDESAVTVIAQKLIQSGTEPVVLDGWQIRYPTLVDDVAVVLRQTIEYRLRHADFGGIFHWSGDEAMSKFDMGLILSRRLGWPTERLVRNPDPPPGAPRPRNCQLDCADLESIGIGQRTPFASLIGEIVAGACKVHSKS